MDGLGEAQQMLREMQEFAEGQEDRTRRIERAMESFGDSITRLSAVAERIAGAARMMEGAASTMYAARR